MKRRIWIVAMAAFCWPGPAGAQIYDWQGVISEGSFNGAGAGQTVHGSFELLDHPPVDHEFDRERGYTGAKNISLSVGSETLSFLDSWDWTIESKPAGQDDTQGFGNAPISNDRYGADLDFFLRGAGANASTDWSETKGIEKPGRFESGSWGATLWSRAADAAYEATQNIDGIVTAIVARPPGADAVAWNQTDGSTSGPHGLKDGYGADSDR